MIKKKIFTHRRHLTRERAHHVDADPAAAGHRAGRSLDRKFERLVELRERFFFSSRRLHTSSDRDWSSDVCSSDLLAASLERALERLGAQWGQPDQAGAR